MCMRYIVRIATFKLLIEEREGGGVLLAINKKYESCFFYLNASSIIFTEIDYIDIIGVKIRLGTIFFYIFNVYVSTNLRSTDYILFDTFESLYPIYSSTLLILGDFNIPDYIESISNSLSSKHVASLINFMSYFNLNQYNNVLNVNNRVLDLVMSTEPCNVVHSQDVFN